MSVTYVPWLLAMCLCTSSRDALRPNHEGGCDARLLAILPEWVGENNIPAATQVVSSRGRECRSLWGLRHLCQPPGPHSHTCCT